jgi:hypothetical protein
MTAPKKQRRGRPWGSKTNRGCGMVADELVPGNECRFYPSVADIVFDVYVLMNAGDSPEEACRQIRDMHGVTVVAESVKRYRESAYADKSLLTIYLPT